LDVDAWMLLSANNMNINCNRCCNRQKSALNVACQRTYHSRQEYQESG